MTIIILAAGLSERMGENKLLLPFNGHELILEPVDIIYAEDYRSGQMASTKRGIESVEDDDFAILPGDLPLITEDDFIGCEKALENHQISRCVSYGIPGHPVMLRKENRERILSFHGTMKEYLSLYDTATYNGSIGCVFDADTPERYRMLLNGDLDLSILH